MAKVFILRAAWFYACCHPPPQIALLRASQPFLLAMTMIRSVANGGSNLCEKKTDCFVPRNDGLG
jgi:hypothetical protein